MMIEFLFLIGLIWIVFAIVQDFKTREVANWLNFSLIIFVLAIRTFWSIFSNDYNPLIFGLLGLGFGFIIANIFYYARLFAGGDAKLLIALFVLIPIENTLQQNLLIFCVFLIALLIAGAIYSLSYSIVLSFIHWKEFNKSLKKFYKKYIAYLYLSFFIALIFLIMSFFGNELLIFMAVILFIFPYLYIYVRAVEDSSLLIYVSVDKITIGDWLVEDVNVKNKLIKPNWEGISEEDLKFLQKNCKEKVLVRYGVPFTPSFLVAFLVIITLYFFGYSDWGLWQFFS